MLRACSMHKQLQVQTPGCQLVRDQWANHGRCVCSGCYAHVSAFSARHSVESKQPPCTLTLIPQHQPNLTLSPYCSRPITPHTSKLPPTPPPRHNLLRFWSPPLPRRPNLPVPFPSSPHPKSARHAGVVRLVPPRPPPLPGHLPVRPQLRRPPPSCPTPPRTRSPRASTPAAPPTSTTSARAPPPTSSSRWAASAATTATATRCGCPA